MIDENDLKKIPYGVSDFREIRENNRYYVDKTRFIVHLEDKGNYLLLIRPRRFGKSLLISTLQEYYDILSKNQYDFLFSGTDIHQHPAPRKNGYMILPLNFSRVNANMHTVQDAFLTLIQSAIEGFVTKYEALLDIDLENAIRKFNAKKSASEVLDVFLALCVKTKTKIYVIIDEYDNFANTILSEYGQEEFEKITHGTGFLRAFFNVLKAGTSDSNAPISRIFMTGVSPITMDDVTSGFNIATNISLDSDINEILGFNKTEVETMIEYYRQSGKIQHTTPELLEMMSHWYNHYTFSPYATSQLFNTDQVLYFLRAYLKESRMPLNMIDSNASIDYGKLRHLIILDKKGLPATNGNFSKLQNMIETNIAKTYIKESFPVMRLAESENFYSLLFYFGLLTITGTTPTGQCVLAIPNEFVRRLYYDIIKEAYEKTKIFKIEWSEYSGLIEDMALAGVWRPLVKFIAGRMEEALNLRDLLSGEKALQVFWNVYLGLSPVYNVYSEKQMNQGFADLVMVPILVQYPELKYSYLFEFKYIKPAEWEKENAAEKIKVLRTEAETQMNQYSLDKKFQKTIENTTLKKLVLIFSGNRLVYHGKI